MLPPVARDRASTPDRREFLSAAALGVGGIMDLLAKDPYSPLPRRFSQGVRRVRGRVSAGGRGLAGIVVSDGESVTTTEKDGRFTLMAPDRARWIAVSLPAGYRIPLNPSGTARLYQPLPPGTGDAEAAFDLVRDDRDGGAHQVLLLADTQTQNAFEMGRLHAESVPAIRQVTGERDVAFGIACGDIMYDDLALYPEYERAVRAIGAPCFQVVGNHDLDFSAQTTEDATATFERHFGPVNYSFNVGEVHYVVLNDVLWHGTGYIGYLTERQLTWLAADLAHVERGRTVVVALHIPLASTRWQRMSDRAARPGETVNNREALLRLLEPYAAHVLAGHTHEMEHVRHGSTTEHIFGTVCGAWWSGDICWDGTPNGFAVLHVRGSEVRWRYHATGRPATEQMRLTVVEGDPRQVVANVWGWDPAWRVTWLADGESRGLMTRATGFDPLAVAQQTGPNLPARRGWVEPVRTDHLFVAAPGTASRVVIEATDPWGVTYTEAIDLSPS